MPNLRPLIQHFAIALTLLAFAGCASVPPPVEQFSAAKAAIANAQAANADTDAPVDFALAKDLLAQAQVASNSSNQALAKQLAERAQVHAELAALKAQHANIRAQIQAAEKRNTDLLNEIRAEGDIRARPPR